MMNLNPIVKSRELLFSFTSFNQPSNHMFRLALNAKLFIEDKSILNP